MQNTVIDLSAGIQLKTWLSFGIQYEHGIDHWVGLDFHNGFKERVPFTPVTLVSALPDIPEGDELDGLDY